MFNPISNVEATNKLFESLSQERKQLQAKGHLPDWYTTQAWQMFKSRYLVPSEGAVRGRHRKIASTLSSHLPQRFRKEFRKKFFELMWEGVLSPSSPALANTGTKRGQPVACSGQDISDDVDGFYTGVRETALLSKHGYGTSGYFGNIRPRGSKFGSNGTANGAKEVIDDFFTAARKISQGGNRPGSFAAYIDMDHGDFYECLWSLKAEPKGKNYGWCITDAFTQRLKDGDADAHQRFKDALHVKLLTGKGYLFFPDKANRHRPEMYKRLGLNIKASNLCSEIMLHSSSEYTYSCILASMNLVHWDRIKDDDSIFTAMVFLDCLCSESIKSSRGIKGLEKVRNFTIKGRATGLGVMGFHTYLQQNGIAYESLQAQQLNYQIFKRLHDETLRASKWLAEVLGEPEWCKGTGLRNTHRTAVAPTKSTALLMGGVAESVSADPGVVFTAGSSVGELDRITPIFYQLMKDKGIYNQDTIKRVTDSLGSIQGMDDLFTKQEQLIFRNAFEMDPWVTFRMAKSRQKWLCQGQSLNFHIPDENAEELTTKLMSAVVLDPDILSSYYLYTRSGVVVTDECINCQA